MMNYLCSTLSLWGMECETPVSLEVQQAFMQHVAEFGLSYGTQEELEFRMKIFAEKDAYIQETNARQSNFVVGHNKFSTYTDYEYKKMLGFKGKKNTTKDYAEINYNVPDSVDWRTKGAVNAVKDQGQCGSCWAFSAVCSMESAHFLKTGELLSLSEQQVVDCDSTSYGCNGGWEDHAFAYAEKHGLALESEYPYTARDGTCKQKTGGVEVSGYKDVTPDSIDALKSAIATQPTSVTIEADQYCFQLYHSGVLDDPSCGTNLDHAVVAVGYGHDASNGKDYYIVRNSWGSSWGDQGYIKIAMESGAGICGIQEQSSFPNA
jgi:cathepsin L